MQVHKIILTVIDFDQLGQKGVVDAIENARYPNRCISPRALSAETREFGDWSDSHPLNSRTTHDTEIERLFSNCAAQGE